jgi:beta-galactosidase
MFRFGVDYYPEHWPEERWETDAGLMREAGMNVIRLAEFAWVKMEPKQDVFDFDWLDRAIEIFHKKGISVLLGTPTASPPPWLAHKNPDILRVREDGLRVGYGSRRKNCPSHPLYRERSRSITTAMAEHFAGNPAVIGWQTDNEFGDRCYCDICRKEFQTWLQQRYGTLDELNTRWGTVFWSHTYSDWEQISLPLSTLGAPPNPSLALDFKRFVSCAYERFQQEQIDILRATCPNHFITHDLMGFGYDGLDYFDLTKPLDFVSWNNYPIGFWHKLPYSPSSPALSHDAMRGIKNKNFWVMEHQAGPTGWQVVSPAPRPGVLRLWAYQSIAHGADGIVFFRWRTARFGAEQYWHGVLEHDGRAGRRYTELQQVGMELKRVGEKFFEAETRSRVAIIQSYDSRFAFQVQGNSDEFGYEKHIAQIYDVLWKRNLSVDVVSAMDDLSKYDLVIAPTLHVLTDAIAANLQSYVKAGGTLVVTPRTGVKDIDNVVVNQPLPGLLAELCGVIVEEYDAITPTISQAITFDVDGLAGQTLPVQIWCDILAPHGAEVIAHYAQDYYAGKPAVTLNKFGQGQAIYLGAIGTDSFYETILGWLLKQNNIQSDIEAPAGVEITKRFQDNQTIYFILNFNSSSQSINLPVAYDNLLNNTIVSGTVQVDANDVLILGSQINEQ